MFPTLKFENKYSESHTFELSMGRRDDMII